MTDNAGEPGTQRLCHEFEFGHDIQQQVVPARPIAIFLLPSVPPYPLHFGVSLISGCLCLIPFASFTHCPLISSFIQLHSRIFLVSSTSFHSSPTDEPARLAGAASSV